MLYEVITFYETAGCLRDVVQNHMFQIVALLAMEAPAYRGYGAVQDKTADVFRAMRPIDPGDLVRGQYAGYRDRITSYNVCYTKLLRETAGVFRAEVLVDDDDREMKAHGFILQKAATRRSGRITSYNVCYTKLLRRVRTILWGTSRNSSASLPSCRRTR